MYWINLAEGVSQLFNTIHAGEPNQTFSARLAAKRFGNVGWYWTSWIWFFETMFPGHLDWAAGED